ncbi:hypothetical protein EVAR_54248_1 [Eumeta japonica]|uniref:Uncharacterized protein n=1 Tax=Eumeta variegata TaxID=151549 RepID=A0A4C1YFJ9_EUMVA|nr:hypothetical protein EVAR_54248_1 [Eumeta japonica]
MVRSKGHVKGVIRTDTFSGARGDTLARPARCHTVTGYRSELAVSTDALRPVSENGGGALPPPSYELPCKRVQI